MMVGFGFTETISYSFIGKKAFDRLRLPPDDPRRNTVDILNPLTEDQAVMRTSLVPGLLETLCRNYSQQVKNLQLFEIGKIYINNGKDSLPCEHEILAGIWTGTGEGPSWHAPEKPCDFFDLKGVVECLITGLNVNDIVFTQLPKTTCFYTRPGHTARILSGSEMLGVVGEIAPQVIRNYDLKQPAFIFEINLDTLLPLVPDVRYATSLPKFPSISRDVTLITDNQVESQVILNRVNNLDEELVESVYLFDVYEGDPVPVNKKSISFRITYRSSNETLEDETVNRLHKDIIDKLLEIFHADLPG
jgi:phenylalanyl-tRNA synthetase beta chain